MEAISFGIPVAGCDVCGMPEIVTKETGVLFPKELDSKETADALSLFLKKKSRNPDLRRAVKSFWKEHYNAALNYDKFIAALNQ
jgi:glycosyltransferase involved in cell wall biosynthesis